MKTRYKIIFCFALLFCILIFAFYARTPARADTSNTDKIAELRKKIDELTRQAEAYRGTVLQKQQEAKTLKNQIDILNNQILRLQSDIGVTQNRIATSEIQLSDLQDQLYSTQKNIDQQKAAIGETMTTMYEHDHVDIVAALLQNSSLSDFVDQAQRLSTLNDRLNQLLKDLKEQKLKLEEQKAGVQQKKLELEDLSERQAAQRGALQGSKTEKNQLLKATKGEESRYQQLLNDAERQKATFFSELANLEHEAVANGTVITHVTATAVPPRGIKIFQGPYHDKFYLTQGYGMTSYAKRGAYGGAIHNGLDEASGCGSPIYAIGTGIVLASGLNNGFGNWVAVKHDAGGGMVSVYGHMVRGTTRSIGTRVDTDTIIGYEGTTGTSTGCHVHLSLYRDFFTYINPKNKQLYFNYADGSLNPADYVK